MIYVYQGLLKIAEALKIKGLVEIEEETISKQTRYPPPVH